jgi:hypothetical protein
MNSSTPNCFRDPEAVAILERVCQANRVDQVLLRELCGLTDRYAGYGLPRGINENIQTMIDDFLSRSKTGV